MKYFSLSNRGIPVPQEPTTVGEHLRKRRQELDLHQSQAAQQLEVSERTLSLWEWDKVYPSWAFQPRLEAYLGFNPFTNPALGRPLGNETQSVAVLTSNSPANFGEEVKKRRIEMKKTRKEFAWELGVSVKTLWSWETNRREPTDICRERIFQFLDGN